ncbi:MAG: biotin--[acetyl-CoA-carboxylase] ligase, partial [Thermoprotei archaeon]
VVLCGAMEGGRGRYRRRWYAPRGGLWFTLILRPRALSSPGVLTLAAGVGVAEALRLLLGIDARLKWPNDIVVDGLKVAGILAEGAAVGGSLSHVLLGIGINVNNELPQELRGYAATLKEALGRVVPRATLFAVVITRVLRRCRDALGERAEEVLRRWRELSDTIGRRVVVKTLWGEVRGVAVGIDRDGRLLVDTGEGVVAVDTGDVIHLRSPGP